MDYREKRAYKPGFVSPFHPCGRMAGWPSIWENGYPFPQATYPAILPSREGTEQTIRRIALFGLAPDGVCHAVLVAKNAVSSYLAVSPLPAFLAKSGRFVFCCTFHPVAGSGR